MFDVCSFLFFFCLVYKTPGVTTGRGQNIFNCKYNSPPPSGKVCDVNVKDFKKCTQENNYSYHKSSPCVFIKMNRIYGWMPTFYNRTEDLPERMPKQLKHRIVNETDPTEVRNAIVFKAFDFHKWSKYVLIIRLCIWNSWTPYGYRAKVKIPLILKISDQLNITRVKASPVIISHMRIRRVIWVHWWPFISPNQHVSQFQNCIRSFDLMQMQTEFTTFRIFVCFAF